MKHKRFLGVPLVAIIAVGVSLLLAGSVVLSAFMFSQTQPGTVTIRGSGAALFKDQACTQPLLVSDVLAFGEVRATAPSSTITVYLFNVGTDNLRPTLKQAGLDSALTLTEATYGVIGTTDKPLYTVGSTSWAPSAFTAKLANAIDASTTSIQLNNCDATFFGTYKAIKVEDEYITFTSYTGTVAPFTLVGVVRGAGGSTAASHTTAPSVVSGTLTYIAEIPLAIGAVLPIALTLTAPGDVSGKLGNLVNFQIIVTVTSNY